MDGLKLIGKPAEIPDCSRDDLPKFFTEMGYKVGAEIGINRGVFSQKICAAGLKLFAVDPWKEYEGYNFVRGQARLDKLYELTKKDLAPYDCTIIRKASMDAVTEFEDESLDFVYVDANHEFRYIAEDVSEWTKKVKPGGIVSGHDYTFFKPRTGLGVCHVISVVNAYIHAYKIQNWYVLGRKVAPPGEKRDKWRSWMFIKP